MSTTPTPQLPSAAVKPFSPLPPPRTLRPLSFQRQQLLFYGAEEREREGADCPLPLFLVSQLLYLLQTSGGSPSLLALKGGGSIPLTGQSHQNASLECPWAPWSVRSGWLLNADGAEGIAAGLSVEPGYAPGSRPRPRPRPGRREMGKERTISYSLLRPFHRKREQSRSCSSRHSRRGTPDFGRREAAGSDPSLSLGSFLGTGLNTASGETPAQHPSAASSVPSAPARSIRRCWVGVG